MHAGSFLFCCSHEAGGCWALPISGLEAEGCHLFDPPIFEGIFVVGFNEILGWLRPVASILDVSGEGCLNTSHFCDACSRFGFC